jgi:hypothetical protein
MLSFLMLILIMRIATNEANLVLLRSQQRTLINKINLTRPHNDERHKSNNNPS